MGLVVGFELVYTFQVEGVADFFEGSPLCFIRDRLFFDQFVQLGGRQAGDFN